VTLHRSTFAEVMAYNNHLEWTTGRDETVKWPKTTKVWD